MRCWFSSDLIVGVSLKEVSDIVFVEADTGQEAIAGEDSSSAEQKSAADRAPGPLAQLALTHFQRRRQQRPERRRGHDARREPQTDICKLLTYPTKAPQSAAD